MKLRRKMWRYGKRASVLVVTIVAVVLLLGGGVFAFFINGGFGPAASSGSVNLSKGLVGWWKLNGNAKDSTPYRDNGTINGTVTPTTGPTSIPNTAMSFDGSTGYVRTPSLAAVPSSQMSICAWIKTSAVNEYIVQGGRSSTDNIGEYVFQLDSTGRLDFWDYGIGGYGFQVASTGSVNNNLWHNVCFTKNGTSGVFYIDGVSEVVSGLQDTAYAAHDFVIGENYRDSNSYFSGSISDVRIYNRALNANEVRALYDGYNSQVNAAQGENGLVGWWKLDGNAKDSTPYANNGTVTGATPTTDRLGASNSAYSFNGTTNSYISIPGNNDVVNATPGTTSLWVKISALPSGGPAMILYHGYNGDAYGIDLELNTSGTVTADARGSGANSSATSTVSIGDGRWHFLTMTYPVAGYSHYTFYLYVDGNLVASANTPDGWRINDYLVDFHLGADMGLVSVNGSIDDLRQYGRMLSAQEIAGLYNSYSSQISLGGDGQTSGINLQKGLVGYWPMNGNAKDATPYSDNGTVNGAALTTDRKGRANSAYSFSSSYIGVANSAALQMSTAVSLSAWVYLTGYTGHVDAVTVKGQAGITWDYGLVLDGSGKLCFRWSNTDQCTSTILPLNQWTHVVVVTDNSTVWYYINGSQDSSATVGGMIHTSTQPLYLGFADASNNYFAGKIDDVRIYNRTLNASEVQALYNEYQ